MVKFISAALAATILCATSVVGIPAAMPAPTPAPSLNNAAAKRATSCTFTDASAAAASKKDCATIVLDNIAVPSGTTLDMTKLEDNTALIFRGETTFGYEQWSGPLISVSGTGIVVTGESGNSINGDGARWWDGKGSNGGKTKPKFFQAHNLDSSSITGLNFLNTPVQCFSIGNSDSLALNDITIDNSAGDTDNGGHNTDAFDVGSSTNITISGANVQNQDDCLAINSGTSITFTGGTCSGGHGLSIGSVGGRSDNTVDTVLIENSSVINSVAGARIKTVYNATGEVKGVTYKNITLSGITSYGIVIEQDYQNGSPTGKPTNGVPITGLTMDGVSGTVSGGVNIYILCGDGSCSDWTWTDVDITGGDTSSDCENIPDGASC